MVFKKKFLYLFLFFCLATSKVLALDVPAAPGGRINDYAGMLDAATKTDLENKLKNFEDQTSTQIVLVTFPSLEGENLEDYSMRLAEKWKIGQKGKDNGAILIIFKNDRKLRIEVGYGLEGALPDALGKQIIQNDIVPAFKQGDFKKGISAGLDDIMAATKGEYKSATEEEVERPKTFWDRVEDLISDIIAKIFAFFIVLIFPLLLLYGLIIRPILRLFWPSKFPKWTSNSSYSGGSSGWSSGSWGGGSWGGGGGFSGGGGSFGGGGSSGSW